MMIVWAKPPVIHPARLLEKLKIFSVIPRLLNRTPASRKNGMAKSGILWVLVAICCGIDMRSNPPITKGIYVAKPMATATGIFKTMNKTKRMKISAESMSYLLSSTLKHFSKNCCPMIRRMDKVPITRGREK
jgi:hypothetical protein